MTTPMEVSEAPAVEGGLAPQSDIVKLSDDVVEIDVTDATKALPDFASTPVEELSRLLNAASKEDAVVAADAIPSFIDLAQKCAAGCGRS
jgi:hypothetical protein